MKTSLPQDSHKVGQIQISDAVVSGWVDGLVSGVVMLAFMLIMGLVSGVSLQRTVESFSPVADGSVFTGLAAHLSVSSVYGLLFGWGWGMVRRRGGLARDGRLLPLAGAAYGAGLWLIAYFLSWSELSALAQATLPGTFLAAHLLYGVVLGLLIRRREQAAS